MTRRIVCYDFSEDDKKLIVSRLLGEQFSQCTSDGHGRYCGYIDDKLCENQVLRVHGFNIRT